MGVNIFTRGPAVKFHHREGIAKDRRKPMALNRLAQRMEIASDRGYSCIRIRTTDVSAPLATASNCVISAS